MTTRKTNNIGSGPRSHWPLKLNGYLPETPIQPVDQLDLGQDMLEQILKRRKTRRRKVMPGGEQAESIANGPTSAPYRNRNSATEVCMICRDDPHRLKKM